MNQQPLIPGFRFRNGRLCIFREQDVLVVHTWPDLKAVRKVAGVTKWHAFWPTFRLIHPYRRSAPSANKSPEAPSQLSLGLDLPVRSDPILERKRAYDSFRFSFPKAISHAVEGFPSDQWSVLLLLKGDPEAMDLVLTHPAIAFLLARRHVGRSHGQAALPSFSHLKQKVLVELFGFPATEAVVNILKRVPAESVSPCRLGRLRAALRDPEIQKALSHLDVVNSGVIELVGDPECWRQCSPRLLQEVSQHPVEKYRAETAETLHQILRMQQAVRPGQRTSFRSRAQLLRTHDELTLEFCRDVPAATKTCAFPQPPLPGLANCIIPLRTPAELRVEGETQRNCVASYAQRVEGGKIFIYRVVFPERATLSIVRGEDGTWERRELTAARNAPVSAKTAEAVEAWLAQYSML